MVVPSQRVLLISFLLLLVSTTLVHAKGNKPKAQGGGGGSVDGDDAAAGDNVDETDDPATQGGKKQLDHGPVTYDARSVIINGKHQLLFSGSIHYPRSPVEVSLLVCSWFCFSACFCSTFNPSCMLQNLMARVSKHGDVEL